MTVSPEQSPAYSGSAFTAQRPVELESQKVLPLRSLQGAKLGQHDLLHAQGMLGKWPRCRQSATVTPA